MASDKLQTDVAVVGAGGCGLTAALAAAELGKKVLLMERDAHIGGSTAMSAGIFVAAGSRLQRASGEFGSPEELAADIFDHNGHRSEQAVTRRLCAVSGPLMDWLQVLGVPLEHMPDYVYPGMRRFWLHSPPQRDGRVIIQALRQACQQQAGLQILVQTRVTGLLTENGRVVGLTAVTPGGEDLIVKAQAVVLGASGFGANAAMVERYIPEFAGAPYYGAPFATGDAIQWGQILGASVADMTAYQSHSSIAFAEQMLVTTYLINHGAIQVNEHGQRFGDETDTYARHALAVQAQPGQAVVEIFDQHILELTLANYPRFTQCMEAGIVVKAESLRALAGHFGLDAQNLEATVYRYNSLESGTRDEYGRVLSGARFNAPYYGIKVTSALVQTLGGLRVNEHAQVLRRDRSPIPGLYAGGGTACGLAGDRPEGYLAGTGLLAAFGLGWIAGQHATHQGTS